MATFTGPNVYKEKRQIGNAINEEATVISLTVNNRSRKRSYDIETGLSGLRAH